MTESDSVKDLNKITLSLAEIRMTIVELMKEGYTEIPLGDLLIILRHMYRQNRESN